MHTHAADADVQAIACVAMASVADCAGSAGVDRALHLARVGATDALVAAVRAHVQHATVPKQALYALYTLAVPCLGPADITLPQQLHAAQIAQAVVAAMRTDITQQDLQAAAASAVEGITQRNTGGVGAAIAQQFLDAGAGEALMEALAASTAHGAARHTLIALAALVHHGGSAAHFLAAGVAEAIMAAVDRLCTRGGTFSADSECVWVLLAAMAIAALATKAPADSARFYAAGACDAVVRAVQLFKEYHHRRNDTSWLWHHPGLEALAALAAAAEAHSQDMALSLVEAGACEAATTFLNAVLLIPALSSSKALTTVLQAICALSADASAAARLNTAGAHKAVANAIPRCSNHSDAAQSARLALDRLAAGAADASSE
ncbi:hypothetical protein JKP88DRAFT_315492 [Tribonema minus]|uniref:Uncharacterized protein n=1 Tax=Tribonema minus TaxID=303371 RepID=A0A835YYM8_9STRA|nr:hypothetical protein JKP88DRAFT_315492 [Tribonema minus]